MALDTSLTNLPLQLTSFIGREREMAEVKRLFGTSRSLTLLGPGGCGKTRLALQVAADLLDEFPDGVWLVDFASLSDPALVPQVVAGALRIREQPGRTFVEALSEFVNERKCLLVLDNCEHLREACAQLARTLLSACPQVQILTTSREALGLEGEAVWLVPSLSMPEAGRPPQVSDLEKYDATRLFVERARTRLSSFLPTGENAAAIARVCQRLDGIPLAIELAAARVNVLTVEQEAIRLDDRFNWLTSNNPTVTLPRHQTLRAAIDWGYELLSEKERVLFRRLAVFAGGFTLDGAEAVCEGDGLAHDQILGVLSQLVGKSLVVAETLQGREARYVLLETIREYAREKLTESDEQSRVQELHLGYHIRFAEEAEPKFYGTEAAIWFDRVENEWDNLRLAIQWSLNNHRGEQGLRIASSLSIFVYSRGHFRETYRFLVDLLKSESTRERALVRAKGLSAAGLIGTFLGDLDWREYYKESIAICRELGKEGRGLLELVLARYALALDWSEPQTAARYAEEAASLCRESGNRAVLASALECKGLARLGMSDLDAARTCFQEAERNAREAGDQITAATASANLALTFYYGNDLEIAERSVREHERLWSKTTLNLTFAITQTYLGDIARLRGGYAEAESRLNDALRLLREFGERRSIAQALVFMARLELDKGNYIEAERSLSEAFSLIRTAQVWIYASTALEICGFLGYALKQPRAAARFLGMAEGWREKLGTPMFPVERRQYEPVLAGVRGRLDEASFQSAWAEGRALIVGQESGPAVDQALRDVTDLRIRMQPKSSIPTAGPVSEQPLREPLTERELEVLNLIAMGLSNQEIAQRLIVAPSTVKWYIQNAFAKLDVHSRTQALARARQMRLL